MWTQIVFIPVICALRAFIKMTTNATVVSSTALKPEKSLNILQFAPYLSIGKFPIEKTKMFFVYRKISIRKKQVNVSLCNHVLIKLKSSVTVWMYLNKCRGVLAHGMIEYQFYAFDKSKKNKYDTEHKLWTTSSREKQQTYVCAQNMIWQADSSFFSPLIYSYILNSNYQLFGIDLKESASRNIVVQFEARFSAMQSSANRRMFVSLLLLLLFFSSLMSNVFVGNPLKGF